MSRMTAIVGPPSQYVSGTATVMTARPRSATNIIRRRSQRSAYAPAGSPIRRSGSVEIAPTIPIAKPEPVSASTSSGSAVFVIASPNELTPWPSRTTLKSRLRARGSGAMWAASGTAVVVVGMGRPIVRCPRRRWMGAATWLRIRPAVRHRVERAILREMPTREDAPIRGRDPSRPPARPAPPVLPGDDPGSIAIAAERLRAGGLVVFPTVGLRVPDHPVARALIRAAGVPVAAPSANRFGHLSPTRAAHVVAGLGSRVDLVLDGGPCRVGVESMVILLATGRAVLLRPGGLAIEAIEAEIGRLEVLVDGAPRTAELAPGRAGAHYAPRIPLELADPRGRA